MTQLIYATTNPGKFAMVESIFRHHDLTLLNPKTLGLHVDVEEVGQTLEENARLKAEAYLPLLPPDAVVIGDDTGITIDALNPEPGIKVRRWKGYPMQDQEIISYCLERMQHVPKNQRGAQFRTVLAIVRAGLPVRYFEGTIRGEILSQAQGAPHEGMPFWQLFYLPQLRLTLGEFHALPLSTQLTHPTHRERAVLAALPYLRTFLDSRTKTLN